MKRITHCVALFASLAALCVSATQWDIQWTAIDPHADAQQQEACQKILVKNPVILMPQFSFVVLLCKLIIAPLLFLNNRT